MRHTDQEGTALASNSVQDVLNKAQNDFKYGHKDQVEADINDVYKKFQSQAGSSDLIKEQFLDFAAQSTAKTEDQQTLGEIYKYLDL